MTENQDEGGSNEENGETLSSADFEKASEVFMDLAKRFMQAFLYLEEACQEASAQCVSFAEAYKAAEAKYAALEVVAEAEEVLIDNNNEEDV